VKLNMKHVISFFFFFNLVLLPGNLGCADEPLVAVTLDKQTARVNEEVHLNIKITGARGGVRAPQLPSLEGFEIFYSGRSSQFNFINGRSQSLTEFNYVLIPRSVGRFIIKPIEVKLDGVIYRTEQLEITIDQTPVLSRQPVRQPKTPQSLSPQGLPASQPTSWKTLPPPAMPSSSSGQSDDQDENIFLKVQPSHLQVYTNEQLILSYYIYTSYDTRYEGFKKEPETSGFWIEEFPMDYKNIGRDSETINGKRYIRADIKKIALFPTAPGEYVIKPGQVKTSVQIQDRNSSMFNQFFNDSFFTGSNLFTRRASKLLSAPPISITVKPLPDRGKPTSFNGAVGDFRMSTEVDKRVINQNEAVTLSITIEGQGNIETLSMPEIPEPPNTKVYESDMRSELYRQRDVIAGSKTFEVILIPSQKGEFLIPGVEFSFFSPRVERYITLKSDPYKIQVNPSKAGAASLPPGRGRDTNEGVKKEIQLESEDIQYIKERAHVDQAFLSRPFLSWFALLNGVLTFGVLGLIAWRQRSSYLDENVSLKRTLRAGKFARRGLKQLNRLSARNASSAKNSLEFFDQCARVLNQYLSDKINRSKHGMTRDVIQRELESRQTDTHVIKKIHACYDLCDAARFGGAGLTQGKRDEMTGLIREIINALE
jgi:hypothetical protein